MILIAEAVLQVLHRMFPFARGLYEDKVANFWCSVSVVAWQYIESTLPVCSFTCWGNSRELCIDFSLILAMGSLSSSKVLKVQRLLPAAHIPRLCAAVTLSALLCLGMKGGPRISL